MIRNKKIIISIIAILLIVLLGTSYFIVQMLENKNQDNKENNKLNYEIKLKLDEEGDEYNCSLPNSNCTIYKIKTETKDAKILSYTDYKNKYVFILYDDNGLKIYDAKKEETQELNLKNDYDGNYELFSNQDKDNIIGIIYRDSLSNIEKYYSLNTKKTINKKILSANLDYGFLYESNGLFAYNIYTDKEEKINLEPIYDEYKLSFDSDKLLGIYYSKNKESGYYNILTNKKMYENTYIEIEGINENYLRALKNNHLGECNGWSSYDYLLSAKEEKVIFSEKEKSNVCDNYFVKEQSGSTYLLKLKGFQAYPTIDIYTKDKKLIASNVDNYNLSYIAGNIYIINDNVLNEYDSSGNLIESNKDYNKLLGFLSNELVYLDNNKLYLKNIKTNNNIEFSKINWSSNYIYEGRFSYVDLKENKKCIAISFKEEIKENEKTYRGLESCYNTNTKTFTNKYIEYGFTNQIWD